MKKLRFLMTMAVCLLSGMIALHAQKVHTIGDSTMAPYDPETTVTRGWGMYLGQFLQGGWTSVNYAKGGRDARGGYNELWQTVKKNMEAGDYVIIQFGHNDEKNGGMDGVELYNYYVSKGNTEAAAAVDQRGTTPSTTYKENLRKIAEEVTAMGGNPVFVAPICRAQWTGGKIRRSGRHDLGDNFSRLTADGPVEKCSVPENDESMDYPYQMMQLANEMGLPFIDLTTATAELYESYGSEKTGSQILDGQGGTHLSAVGGVLVARRCAELMKKQGILADQISLPTDISISPDKGDFGKGYKGNVLQGEFTLSGFGLSPEEGSVSVTASAGVTLSTDKNNWSSSLALNYNASTLISTFYARIALEEDGENSGTITVSQGDKTISVPVNATAVTLSDGEEANAYWRLGENDECTVSGNLIPIAESWHGMYVQRYANPNASTVWPEWTGFDSSRKMQRNLITGDNWPADEIDDNPERYIEFGVTASAGTELDIDSIGLFVCGAGGSGMMCHIYYSTDNFETRTTIFSPSSITANNPVAVQAKPIVTLDEGQSLRLRIYPWYSNAASGKTICISDVTIHGMAREKRAETAIDIPNDDTHPFVMEKGELTTSRGNFSSDHHIDYMMSGDYATYQLANLIDAKYYDITFTAGTKQNDVTLNFCIKSRSGIELFSQDIDIENNGNWDAQSRNYSLRTGEMPKGNYVLTITFRSVGGNGTTANVNNILFTGKEKGDGGQQYTLAVAPSNEKAGTVKTEPNASVFEEGEKVKLTATAEFGYHFEEWQDAEGNTVSTDNPYTFSITGNTQLTARFAEIQTYALHLTLTDGARDNLVEIQPAGTMIDGRRMYEEGEEVTLTAKSNKILTFVGWEDNSTSASRTVKMDGEQNLTAQFSAQDYIVGWDFYYDQPASERAADYKSDTENAGLLSLHNESGKTISWLSRGIERGAENGRWAARIWKNRTDGYFFEISFSAKGYQNIKVSNALGVNYNTYSRFVEEYSTDGENYKPLGEWNLQKGWTDQEFALPAEADEAERVWVRWVGDKESPLVGNETDYDGLAITDIFVTADAGSVTEEHATLVSCNPAAGATGVSANGAVILSFDHKIKAGEGCATLNGEEITPIISGKSAVFKYSGLKYSTEYTFSMPEGVLLSRSGNKVSAAEIRFSTMERQQPEARLYDAIVAPDGSGDYTTVQEAVDAAPAGRSKPWLIFIKNGVYDGHVTIPSNKPYMHLIGQQRDHTIIIDDRQSGVSVKPDGSGYSVNELATMEVQASNTFFENLTMENRHGHENQSGPQALALGTFGDRIALNNVALLSYQDTWITTSTSNNRHYIKNSLIEGAVDFIYNSGNVYLDGDTLEINRPSGGFIVAPSHASDVKWGYVFQNCIIRPHKGMNVTDVWLGRPWHGNPKTVYINTQTFVELPAKGWYNHMGGLPVLWADYNTIDANGNPVDLSQREDTYWVEVDGKRVEQKAKNHITAEEAAAYTIKNVCGGEDNWQPDLMCEICETPVVTITDRGIEWEAVPYAICYVVTKGNDVVGFTTECNFDCHADGTYRVQAVNEYGGLSEYGVAGNPTGITMTGKAICDTETIHNLSGIRLAHRQKGVNIVNGKKTVVR
ncbi:MAG: pectinesterase family protein [Prevotella sp.]